MAKNPDIKIPATEIDVAKNSVEINNLKSRQDKMDKTVESINDGIMTINRNMDSLNTAVRGLQEGIANNNEENKDKDISISKIHAELREIKISQDSIYDRIDNRDKNYNESIEEVKQDLKNHKTEMRTEIKRLEERVTAYSEKTKVDWLDMLGNGFVSVLSEIFKLGVTAFIVYGAMKLKG